AAPHTPRRPRPTHTPRSAFTTTSSSPPTPPPPTPLAPTTRAFVATNTVTPTVTPTTATAVQAALGTERSFVHSAWIARDTIHRPAGAVLEVIPGPPRRRRRRG